MCERDQSFLRLNSDETTPESLINTTPTTRKTCTAKSLLSLFTTCECDDKGYEYCNASS
jgi:hypothetical protein